MSNIQVDTLHSYPVQRSQSPVPFVPTYLREHGVTVQQAQGRKWTVGSIMKVEGRIKGQGRMVGQNERTPFIITEMPRYTNGWFTVEAEEGSTYRRVLEKEMLISSD
ncbi:hypothetical protein BgiBS90_004723 [Biomphalaria glabrata]|nr:hypothetical protein BgiBS90_004723 [Biomphalaria glabrata]